MIKRTAALLGVAALVALPVQAQAAAPGQADPDFNGGQPYVYTEAGGSTARFGDVLVDGLGRVIAGGATDFNYVPEHTNGALVRLLQDGTPDPAFGGGDGIVTPQYDPVDPGTPRTEGHGVLHDPNGRLGAAWSISSSHGLITGRYTDNGSQDSTYATAGLATVDPTGPDDSGYGAELRQALATADGSTVLIAESGFGGGYFGWTRVIKLDPEGALDPAFGTGGRATNVFPTGQPIGDGNDVADGILYPDGRVLVVGSAGTPAVSRLLITRFLASGQVDPSFGGGDGSVDVALGSLQSAVGAGVALAPDDAIFAAGTGLAADNSSTAVLVKLTPEGVVDPGFGTREVPKDALAPGEGSREATATAVTVQGDGKPVIVGTLTSDTGYPRMFIARLTTAGDPDTTVDGDGASTHVIAALGGADPHAIAQTRNGKLVVAGETSNVSGHQAFVERFILRDPSEIRFPELRREPGLTGVPSPGQTLTCTPGEWTNTPTIAVVWERAPRSTTSAEDPAWGAVAGTTANTYAVVGEDLGSRMRCREVATNGDGTDTAPSASKRVDVGIPVNTSAPVMSGTPIAGQTLTCDPGLWDNGPDLTFQWLRGETPIIGASGRTHVIGQQDRRNQISCLVAAANDVGAAASLRSNAMLAVGEVPRSTKEPKVLSGSIGPKPTDVQMTCQPGEWDDDYGQYEYRWQREGAEIAGETAKTYNAGFDDLGRLVSCEVISSNPVGRSLPARSRAGLVPLPNAGPEGKVYQAGGFNEYDPLNMMAVSADYLSVIREVVINRLNGALAGVRTRCLSSGRTGLPDFDATSGRKLSSAETCQVLNHAPAGQVEVSDEGVYWHESACLNLHQQSASGGATRAGPSSSAKVFSGPIKNGIPFIYTLRLCPQLDVTIAAIDPSNPPGLGLDNQPRLQAAQPREVLWDFNSDGRVDATCATAAPILRSLYGKGIYRVRAVIADGESEATGVYSIASYQLAVHAASTSQKGALRPAQPFACRSQLDPPPEPERPCTDQLYMGRVHLEGNLCPISLRRIPQSEVNALPADVQAVLRDQALGSALRAARARPVERAAIGGLRAAPDSLAYTSAVQISALSTFTDANPTAIPASWGNGLKRVGDFSLAKSLFALDQIYIAKGTAKLNGVTVDPRSGSSLVVVPSDVHEALATVKKMTVVASNAATSLGSIPLGNPSKLATDLIDKVGVAPPTLRDVNLDALAESLKSKLNLGPFKLAGETKIRLADDGTAFLDAYAELPNLLSAPGSSPIRTKVTIRADRSGKVKLQGIHLEAGSAYLAALKIKDLLLDYDTDAGLIIQGKLLFPPVDAGISINRFRLDGQGRFKELDVDYLAGAGTGIPVGTGIFLTRLGGGFSMDPDEIRGRATISVGPSTGGGCATVGVDASFAVHFAPPPFNFKANGTVQVVCISLVSVDFYADATGLVDLHASVDLDLGPLYFSARFGGTVKLPNWQVDLRGEGGIRGILSAQIKALIGNKGVAGCGRIEIIPETPISDAVTLAGGAGVRFPGGRPPLSFPELIGNIHLFWGCDLSSWSPFGRDVRAVGGGGRTFTVKKPAPAALALEVIGAGGVPKVRLRAPDGKVIDATGAGPELIKTPDAAMVADTDHSRLVLFVRGQAGQWTIEPADGSPAIVELGRAQILPTPKVTATVGGIGASRTLRYRVAKIAGQVVQFVEESTQGRRVIKTVKGGGSGTAAFVTSEGRGTARTVTAEIVQDGMPRDSITVARFHAPSPRVGRPGRVRVVRRGSRGLVTWGAAPYAARYEVVVQTGDGARRLLSVAGRTRRAQFGGLVGGEGARVTVVGLAPSGRRGARATGRLAGSLRHVSITPRPNPKKRRPRRGPA